MRPAWKVCKRIAVLLEQAALLSSPQREGPICTPILCDGFLRHEEAGDQVNEW